MTTVRIAVVVVACLGTACSDDTKTPVDARQDKSQPDAVSVDARRPDRVSVDTSPTGTCTGTLRGFTSKQPLGDVDICLYQNGKKTNQCTKSDATGAFSFTVPAKTEVALLFERGNVRWAVPVVVDPSSSTNLGTWSIFTESEIAAMFTKVGAPYPPVGNGLVWVNGHSGDKIAIVQGGGIGPYYVDISGLVFDLSLTAMTGGSFPAGAVFNLPPGSYDVQVSNSTKKCVNRVGWPSTTATLRTPVLDGYFAVVSATCT